MNEKDKLSGDELLTDIKKDITALLKVIEKPKIIEESLQFTESLANLIWNTRNFINHFSMIVSSLEYDHMINHHNKRIDSGLRIDDPEINNGPNKSTIKPAKIADGYNDKMLNESSENVFSYLKSHYLIEEQLELLSEILKWYNMHIVLHPMANNKDFKDITGRVNKINESIKEILG